MANFMKFKEAVTRNFEEMSKDATHLFEVDLDKDELWNTYLNSFPVGTNPIYRERTVHDCSCCRQFIKNIGGVVSIKDQVVHTIWDVNIGDDVYQAVCDALDAEVKSRVVKNVYFSPQKKVGCDFNYEDMGDGVHRWDHLYLELPDKVVIKDSVELNRRKAELRDTVHVFGRSLRGIDIDAINTVLELIKDNTLYKGAEWQGALTELKKYKEEYDKLEVGLEMQNTSNWELYSWEKGVNVGPVIGRIRNHSIGVLLVDISDGMDLEEAVKKYEKIVAPTNYKRPKAIFTAKMLEDAKKKITELGYLESLQRRFATLDDITINNVLFANRNASTRMAGGIDVFEEMKAEVTVNPKRFSNVPEISAQEFINSVLPTATNIDILLENKHSKNFVSMIAPVVDGSKNMLKWDNPLSWAYTGNITDSDVRANVKAAGGNVEGVLRGSIQWNECGTDNCDLDIHCIEPNGCHIYYGQHCKSLDAAWWRWPNPSAFGGILDVDIRRPMGKIAVENIVYADKSRMRPGVYEFYIHAYQGTAQKGFRAEIEIDGKVYQIDYPSSLRHGYRITLAKVELDKQGNFTMVECLNHDGNGRVVGKDNWGVKTYQFTPVSVVSYSPNYFDEQEGIGHKHLFFFLNGCKNPEEPHGFYNEFLKEELLEHKRVFEALGAKCHVETVDDQLSGVGFSMTKRADIVVRVNGDRVMRVKF